MTGNSTGRKQAGRLERTDGGALAYVRTPGRGPGVVFMPGFRSDMEGGKALALEAWCAARGHGFLRFDYSGHGQSPGAFTDGTIGAWAADAVAVIDALADGPQVLVGSSMGGWIMLLAALARPQRTLALVGIAAAPDFTEDLIWRRIGDDARRALMRDGVYHEPSQYSEEPTPITRRLIEEGRRHLLLRKPIPLACPVRLIHGMQDPDVPWETAQRIALALVSDDVEMILVKNGGHRLSEPHDLQRLERVVGALLDRFAGE